MFDIVTGIQMKDIEQKWINEIGIPSLSLMESAANSIANVIRQKYSNEKKILIVANVGNNGGDALAVGRLLIQSGYDVTFSYIGSIDKMTEECRIQNEILQKLGVSIGSSLEVDLTEADVIVDGIFGIGLTRNISGEYYELINKINDSDCKVVAVDIPSGINADNGKVMGIAIEADVTVELGIRKLGNHLYPGCEYAGEVEYSDIGLNNYFGLNTVKILENSDISKKLPKRKNDSNKGTYGKILCICGSYNMAGAAVLSATAAYKTGAGLVKVFTDIRNREIIQRSIPEALLSTYDDMDFSKELHNSLEWADTVLIGCGLGQNDTSIGLVKETLQYFEATNDKKLVIDADALNIISNDSELLNILPTDAIITPHVMEMSRLTGMSVKDIKDKRFEIAANFAKDHKCVVVLKDSRTVITDYNENIFLNVNGNNGMATGGSGDVLAGMIASIASGSSNMLESAVTGVYMHGLSADLCIGQNTYETLISSDIYGGISSAYKLVTNDKK